MPVHGPRQIVASTNAPDEVGGALATVPTLEIFVPEILPLQLEYAVRFRWSRAGVANFTEADISVIPSTITLSDFDFDGQEATIQMLLPDNIFDAAEITVAANSANFQGQTVPENDVSATFMFDTRPIPDPNIGTVRTVREYDYDALPDLDTVRQAGEAMGGAFTNVLDIVANGNWVYLVVQISKYGALLDGTTFLDRTIITNRQAGAALYRIDVSASPPTWDFLKAYPSVTLAARSLTVKDNRVYFFEGSHYAYLNEGQTTLTDADGNATSTPYRRTRLAGVPDDWKGRVGYLRSIANPELTITDHGLTAVSAEATDSPYDTTDRYYGVHGGTASPMVDDGDLNVISGYGILERIESPEDEVSRGENWQRVRYSDDLRMKVPRLDTNEQTGFEVIKALATLSNSIVGFDNDTFFFLPREPLTASLALDLSAIDNTGLVTINDLSRALNEYPASGMFTIGNELFSYTAIDSSGTSVSGVTRAINGTTAAAHSINEKITWIDHYLGLNTYTLNQPIDDISIVNDEQNIYNRITVSYEGGQYGPIDDAASITTYGILPLRVTVALGSGNLGWVKWIAETLLARYKQPAMLLNLDLKWSQHLKVADTVYVHVEDRVNLQRACQVISVNHDIRIDGNGSYGETRVKLLGV